MDGLTATAEVDLALQSIEIEHVPSGNKATHVVAHWRRGLTRTIRHLPTSAEPRGGDIVSFAMRNCRPPRSGEQERKGRDPDSDNPVDDVARVLSGVYVPDGGDHRATWHTLW